MNLSDKVVYQIYPKSFYDTNGDGRGDLQGIIEKLDYVADLGADLIWINPFYPSPQRDNGYDISDYTAIHPGYGTMEDFECLVLEAHQRGIGLMLDMVLNHVSTEHEWFKKALSGDKYYQDFFYLRPAKDDGSLPTNWESKFGGPAWEKFGETDLYYLHLYDVTQADLNWYNPNLRKELYQVVNFWLKKGVKGLRFDVLNVIGKNQHFIDSKKPGSAQEKSLYTDTPIVHTWIKELNEQTYGQYQDIITVGEMSSTTVSNGVKYSNPEENELSMIFSFHHLKVDYENGEKWTNPDFDFIALKSILNEWQEGMSRENGWNALFLNNHDQPRSNSRFGDVKNYPFQTQTMLATAIQLLRGTPYIYQGEEIGMTDPNFSKIEDYRDIETLNNYQIMIDKGIPSAQALQIIQAKSRDNSRTPMQWNSSQHAGFTQGTPWINTPENYQSINVENKDLAPSIFTYYQDLIKLRKEYQIIQVGDYQSLMLDHPQVFAYSRNLDDQTLLVLNHFYPGEVGFEVPITYKDKVVTKIIGNGPLENLSQVMKLGAYETAAFLMRDEN